MTGFELKLSRRLLGLCQEGMGEHLGVTRKTYASYEKQAQVPKVIVLAVQSLVLKHLLKKELKNLSKESILYQIDVLVSQM